MSFLLPLATRAAVGLTARTAGSAGASTAVRAGASTAARAAMSGMGNATRMGMFQSGQSDASSSTPRGSMFSSPSTAIDVSQVQKGRI